MKKSSIVILILLAVVIVAGVSYKYLYKDDVLGLCKTTDEVCGFPAENFNECLEAGYPVMERYPRQCQTPEGKIFTEDIGNELEKADLIKIDNPRPNQEITSPLIISGQARGNWYFEADFPVKLLNENGEVIASGIATAQGEWMTEEFVPFTARLTFSNPESDKGSLVLEKDNPSGLPEHDDKLIVPVRFGVQPETQTIKVYFNNNLLDPEVSCNLVFASERQIAKTQAVGRAALEELLTGPTEVEKAEGFYTSLNNNIKLQSLTIEDGIARADFNDQLQYQTGGSCRIAAIRAQITQTLKQFPTVEEVIISINGRTEDILQP